VARGEGETRGKGNIKEGEIPHVRGTIQEEEKNRGGFRVR